MDCPASDSPACARASSRLSRGIVVATRRRSDTKSRAPPLSSIRCAMHAAELRKKRSASVSWSCRVALADGVRHELQHAQRELARRDGQTRAHASAPRLSARPRRSAPRPRPPCACFGGRLSTSASVAALAAARPRAPSPGLSVAARRLDRGQQHKDEHRAPLDQRVGLLGVLVLLLAVAQRVPPVQADAAAQQRHRRLLAHLLAVGDRVAQLAERAPDRQVREQRQALRASWLRSRSTSCATVRLRAVGAQLGRALGHGAALSRSDATMARNSTGRRAPLAVRMHLVAVVLVFVASARWSARSALRDAASAPHFLDAPQSTRVAYQAAAHDDRLKMHPSLTPRPTSCTPRCPSGRTTAAAARASSCAASSPRATPSPSTSSAAARQHGPLRGAYRVDRAPDHDQSRRRARSPPRTQATFDTTERLQQWMLEARAFATCVDAPAGRRAAAPCCCSTRPTCPSTRCGGNP